MESQRSPSRVRHILFVMVWVLQGLIGVAFLLFALGAGPTILGPLWALWVAGTLLIIGVRRKARPGLLVVMLGVSVPIVEVVAVPVVAGPVQDALYCGGSERAVLSEFPQLGRASIQTHGDSVEQECFGSFGTSAGGSAVVAYYREQLQSHGWKVAGGGAPPAASEEGAQGVIAGTIVGVRGRDRYEVTYESVPSPDGTEQTTVTVGVRS